LPSRIRRLCIRWRVVHIFFLDAVDSTRHSSLAAHGITNDKHFIEHLIVFLQRYIDNMISFYRNLLKKAIELSPKKDAFYYYLMGELYYFSNHPNNNKTIQYYKKALNMEKTNSRLHAMTAFALSEVYQKANNLELMEHYLLVAAISDITSATKENVALQDIALFIYKHKTRSLNKAQEYINLSLEDAYTYKSRLRRIEISSKLQLITNAYTDDIKTTNRLLNIALLVIILLLLGVGISSLFIRKKNRLLKQKKDEITATSAKMEVLNGQLHLINDELKDTNQKRERLVKVYIDLCYKNIERNSKLRTLAVRKIKANQSKELLSLLSSSTNTEKENKEFLTEFDKAFLSLYPTFISELHRFRYRYTIPVRYLLPSLSKA
jgi:hypothetical protein